MVTVRDIPGFASLRRRVMTGVSACGARATSARVTDFPDGTSRRTVAAVTEGFRPRDDVDLEYAEGDARAAEACSEDLLADVKTFRELVSSVSRAFVERLGESFPSRDGSPMLRSADAESDSFEDVGVGTGTVVNRPGIKMYQDAIRERAGDKIAGGKVIKVEAHPIPEHYRPRRLKHRAMLVGDAAGYVTKCSGEGIYFAAKSGRMAGEAVVKAMAGGTKLPTEAELEDLYIKPYDKLYFPTYTVLDILQKVFYTNNAAREAFVDMCRSEYVQDVTFQSYLYKRLVTPNPVEDIKLLFGTVGSLLRGRAIATPDKPFSNPVESLKRL